MKRFILRTLVTALAIFVVVRILPGIRVDSLGSLIVTAILLGLFNAILRPLLILLTLPITVLSLGLFIFIINGLILYLAAALVRRPRRGGRCRAGGEPLMLSLVVPVYRNEASIPDLLGAVEELDRRLNGDFEAVFVVDGSPDRSLDLLTEAQVAERFPALRTNLPALYAGYYVAELLTEGTEDYDPHPVLFDAALAAERGWADGGMSVAVATQYCGGAMPKNLLMTSSVSRSYRAPPMPWTNLARRMASSATRR